MTGAQITSTFDDAQFRGALEHLTRFSADKRPLLWALGQGMVRATQQHFLDARDPEGQPWKALNPTYAEFKRGPGILRGARFGSIGLFGSLKFKVEGGDAVAWGSSKIYAAVHQGGAVIVPVKAKQLSFRIGGKWIHCQRVVIPARPYLGFGPEEKREALENVFEALNRAITGYSARQILGG